MGENDRISGMEDTEKSREIMGDHLLFLVFSLKRCGMWAVMAQLVAVPVTSGPVVGLLLLSCGLVLC